jgi:hypothetical protein
LCIHLHNLVLYTKKGRVYDFRFYFSLDTLGS